MKRGLFLNLKSPLENLLTKEMGMDAALELIKFSSRFAVELTTIEQKRIVLVKRYGDKKEDGNIEVLDEAKKEKFKKAFEKILAEDIEFDLLNPVVFASLRLTPPDAAAFKPLFK
jgi:hypothetical protein